MDALIPEGAKKGCAIFAHPDDESLWCGGLLSRGDVDWTVICCSIPHRDPIRAYKFFSACEVLGARPRLLPFSERERLHLEEIDLSPFDVVLTHGLAGEYGHEHHVELHRYIAQRYAGARFIGYGGPGRFSLPLDAELKAKKLEALRCYNHEILGDGAPKWQMLIDYYGQRFDLWTETYD